MRNILKDIFNRSRRTHEQSKTCNPDMDIYYIPPSAGMIQTFITGSFMSGRSIHDEIYDPGIQEFYSQEHTPPCNKK